MLVCRVSTLPPQVRRLLVVPSGLLKKKARTLLMIPKLVPIIPNSSPGTNETERESSLFSKKKLAKWRRLANEAYVL